VIQGIESESEFKMRLITSVVTAAFAAACTSAEQAGMLDPQTAEGRFLVEVHCGECHAWRGDDRSKHPEAPPLRQLSRNYPVSALEEALGEGIVVGHPDMPEFRFRPEDVAAVIAWLEHIQER
jgi:mono/diheme cytochrome c family protein